MTDSLLTRKPFELIAGHPVLDFVNTLDNRFTEAGPIELLPAFSDFLLFASQAELISDRQFRKLKKLNPTPAEQASALAEAIQLREVLAVIAYALIDHGEPAINKPPMNALSTLETIFKHAALQRKLVPAKEGLQNPSLTWEFKGISKNLHSPIWLLAQSANDLLTSPQSNQIWKCASPTCQWLFLDTSKNHTRRWCDMKICGNRNKARLFHLRQSKTP